MSGGKGEKRLHRCHICEKEFDQYELELHFLNSHDKMDEGTDKENDKCHDDVQRDPLKSVTYKCKTTSYCFDRDLHLMK